MSAVLYRRESAPSAYKSAFNDPMHELALTQNLLNVAVQHAQQAGAQRVLGVNLALAQCAHETEESIQFYWGLLSADTLAQGARLQMRRVPVAGQCADCGHAFVPEAEPLLCPACFSPRVTLESDLLRVESIDVE